MNKLTDKEKHILDKIVETHNLFMEDAPPSDMQEWCECIHKLQAILSLRLLRRIHPEIFR